MSESLQDQLLALGLAKTKPAARKGGRKRRGAGRKGGQGKGGAGQDGEISLDAAYRARQKAEREKTERVVPFSCKSRGLCSSCGQKRAILWAERMVEEVLPDVRRVEGWRAQP